MDTFGQLVPLALVVSDRAVEQLLPVLGRKISHSALGKTSLAFVIDKGRDKVASLAIGQEMKLHCSWILVNLQVSLG